MNTVLPRLSFHLGMKLSRYLLDFEIPGKCIGINADVRTFNWTVSSLCGPDP